PLKCERPRQQGLLVSSNQPERHPMPLKSPTLRSAIAFAVLAISIWGNGNPAAHAASKANASHSGWMAPRGAKQILIWPGGAPDMPATPQAAERVEVTKVPDLVTGRPYISVYDVTSPTMTVFPAKGRNTGTAMIVFPGGGFQLLAMDLEGTEICDWMVAKGIT